MKLPDLPPVHPNDVPRDPQARATWILIHLRKRGVSMRQLSLRDGYSANYYNQCLYRPVYPAEAAIAEVFGLALQDLFVERYDRQGNRLPQVRSKNTRQRCTRECQNAAVA